MIIHQAIYGEKSGHALLNGSANETLLKRISGSTDLTDRPDGGILEKPIVRGFFLEDHFLLVKYFPDTNEGIRRGRVFSHVLIVDEQDFRKLDDISELFEFHLKEVNKEVKLTSFEFESSTAHQCSNSNPKERVATNAVLQNGDDGTIVWVGEEGYWDWIKKVWRRIPIGTRKNVLIGRGFNPGKIKGDKLSLLHINEESQSSWSKNSSFRLITNDLKEDGQHDLVNWLLSDEDSPEVLNDLFRDFEPKIDSISELVAFYDLGKHYQSNDRNKDIGHLLVFSDYISRILPSETTGKVGKIKLTNILVKGILSSDTRIIKALKHQSWLGFPNGVNMIGNALRKWLGQNLFLKSQSNGDIILQAISAEKDNWWGKEVLNFLLSKMKSEKFNSSETIWGWLLAESLLIKEHVRWLPLEVEEKMLESAPKLKNDIVESLLDLARQKQWMKIHANLASRHMELNTAIGYQLDLDTNHEHFDGIREILKNVKKKEFVVASSKIEDERFHIISGELLKEKPDLINSIDLMTVGGQRIWENAINQGNDVWAGIKHSQKVLHGAIDLLVSGQSFSDILLRKISESDTSSLFEYHNRKSVWSLLNSDVKHNFTLSTCIDIVIQLEKNDVNFNSLEPELKSSFKDQGIIHSILSSESIPILSKIRFFEKNVFLNQNHLNLLVEKFRLNSDEAKKIGELIQAKNWILSAEYIYDKVVHRYDLHPTLERCFPMFNIFQRFRLSNKLNTILSIDENEWWTNFEHATVELYSSRNSIETVWRKAGGKVSELLLNGTAVELWSHALNKLRRNQLKSVSTESLLYEINKQYGGNNEFKLIYSMYSKISK